MKEVKYITGDLVMFDGRVMPITNIDYQTPYRVEIQMENRFCTIASKAVDKYIKPVPITLIILAANGFKIVRQDESGALFYKSGLGVDIVFSIKNSDYKFCMRGMELLNHAKYCHQLQHLLFGLGLDSSLKV